MSQHIDERPSIKYVYGWDQQLQSFFLQVHDKSKEEDDENRIVVWLGADQDTIMYEVEQLVRAAQQHGLYIPHAKRVKLYGEKDEGL